MKNRKIVIALSLVLASLLMFFGCGTQKDVPEQETTTTTQITEMQEAEPARETTVLDELPAKDLGGITFRMLGVSYSGRRNFPTEEESGEIVNDALTNRDLIVSDKLNIKIETQSEADAASVTSKIQNSIAAGENICDVIISDIATSLVTLMSNGSLYDLRQIPDLALDQSWWSAGMYSNASINGRQYITMGIFLP